MGTALAQELDSKDIRELRKMFKDIDKNGDGMLETAEIKQIVEKVRQSGSKSIDAEALEMALLRLDTDNSGKVDWSEFLASMSDRKMYLTQEAMWRAFRRFALDGDGKITKAEMKTVLAETEEAGDLKAAEIIKEGDLN